MARIKRPLPDGSDWVGKRVAYKVGGVTRQSGVVQRMANGKSLCMFVLFDGEQDPRLMYAENLERV